MVFRLREVTTDEQIEQMVPCVWAAFTHPRNPSMELLNPIRGTGPSAVAEAIENMKKTLITQRHDITANFLQILDSDNSDAIIAVAMWYVRDKEHNPFSSPSKDKPTMAGAPNPMPKESEIDKFAFMIMVQSRQLKSKRQTRPHLHPEYRRRGAATILVEWGIKKADELGVEIFSDATPSAIPFYNSLELRTIDNFCANMTIPNPSEEWKELERKYCPFWWANMWRPIHGKFEKGDKYPWDEEATANEQH